MFNKLVVAFTYVGIFLLVYYTGRFLFRRIFQLDKRKRVGPTISVYHVKRKNNVKSPNNPFDWDEVWRCPTCGLMRPQKGVCPNETHQASLKITIDLIRIRKSDTSQYIKQHRRIQALIVNKQ